MSVRSCLMSSFGDRVRSSQIVNDNWGGVRHFAFRPGWADTSSAGAVRPRNSTEETQRPGGPTQQNVLTLRACVGLSGLNRTPIVCFPHIFTGKNPSRREADWGQSQQVHDSVISAQTHGQSRDSHPPLALARLPTPSNWMTPLLNLRHCHRRSSS